MGHGEHKRKKNDIANLTKYSFLLHNYYHTHRNIGDGGGTKAYLAKLLQIMLLDNYDTQCHNLFSNYGVFELFFSPQTKSTYDFNKVSIQ